MMIAKKGGQIQPGSPYDQNVYEFPGVQDNRSDEQAANKHKLTVGSILSVTGWTVTVTPNHV